MNFVAIIRKDNRHIYLCISLPVLCGSKIIYLGTNIIYYFIVIILSSVRFIYYIKFNSLIYWNINIKFISFVFLITVSIISRMFSKLFSSYWFIYIYVFQRF